LSDIRVPFLDLKRQDEELRQELLRAFDAFLASGRRILGSQVRSLEEEFASFCGLRHGVGVASGTDALTLTLKALGVGEGDEVVTTALSAPPTAVAVALAGARPVFADIDPVTMNIDPASVQERITPRTRFLLPVHLYGLPADMPALLDIATAHGLQVVEDCAQAHGSSIGERRAGAWGKAGCYSFYPTKNLGAYGDGGMVVTDDPSLAERLRSLREYGKSDRDNLGCIGLNSRLDELQAALLRLKLPRLEEWNGRRKRLAQRYLESLEDLPLRLPAAKEGWEHCFHLFVIRCRERDALRAHLAGKGIETLVHYPVPLHLQKPFQRMQPPPQPCPAAEEAASQVLSLPLYPHLTEREQDAVIEAVRDFYRHR